MCISERGRFVMTSCDSQPCQACQFPLSLFPFSSVHKKWVYFLSCLISETERTVCIESEFAWIVFISDTCINPRCLYLLTQPVYCLAQSCLTWDQVARLHLLVCLMGIVSFESCMSRRVFAVKAGLEDVSDCVGVATCISRLS